MTKTVHVLLLDTGKEWGGGTNSLLEWLRRRDRVYFQVTCVFYYNYVRGGDGLSIAEAVSAAGADFLLLSPSKQPLWSKFAKELARGFLYPFPKVRTACVEAIEKIWRIRPMARRLAALVVEKQANILYMNNSPASNYEGYLAGAATGIPVVQHCRTLPKLSPSLTRLVNSTAKTAIAVSQSVATSLVAQGVMPGKVKVVHDGIDFAQGVPTPVELSKKIAIPVGSSVLVTVASLLPRKGVADVIQAVALLKQPAHLMVLGDGPQKNELKILAARLGVAERIHFLGFVPNPLPWVAAANGLILASASEGLGIVLLEAMFLSKPVVASNVSGIRDVVKTGQTGWLFPYGDIPALAGCLSDLLSDPLEAEARGAAGRTRVVINFDIENYVTAVSQVVTEALQS